MTLVYRRAADSAYPLYKTAWKTLLVSPRYFESVFRITLIGLKSTLWPIFTGCQFSEKEKFRPEVPSAESVKIVLSGRRIWPSRCLGGGKGRNRKACCGF